MEIITGNANPNLAKEICKYLKMPLGDALVTTFNEGEIRVKINKNVRGKDVFIVQPTCPPVNNNLMELLILIDALKRASAKRITAVLPYFGYARQDRKDQPRVPITAKLVANLITTAGVDRILTVDLHAGQIQGFFDIPMDHLYAVNIFVSHIKKIKLKDIVIVSPDVGGIKMARAYAKKFEAPLAIVDKRRISGEETEAMNILGDIKGKNLIIVDDLVATASSLVEAAVALKKQGGKDIYAAITHPVLSGPAIKRINDSILTVKNIKR
jgi:ribose-phosphate pyrophosphokinase